MRKFGKNEADAFYKPYIKGLTQGRDFVEEAGLLAILALPRENSKYTINTDTWDKQIQNILFNANPMCTAGHDI